VARRLAQLAHIPVDQLNGVGAERAKALSELGIASVLDLLTHYPRRYIDRTHQAHIRDLKMGEEAMVLAKVLRVDSRRTRGRPPKVLVSVDINDGTGSLRLQFFNQPWRAKQLSRGTEAVFFGKLDNYKGQRQLVNPIVDLIGDRTGRVVPVYPQSEKARIHTWDLGRWIGEALERAGEMVDPMPEWVLDRFDLVDRTAAFQGIHLPTTPRSTRRPASVWCSTSCCGSSWPWSNASGTWSAPPAASPTASRAPWSSSSGTDCRSSGPTTSARPSTRSART
jgi:ATP-dependent DNA helicase RecG